jgi:hypothetical protein
LFVDRADVAAEIFAGFAESRVFPAIEPDGKQPRELGRTKALTYSVKNLGLMLDIALRAKQQGVDLFSAAKNGSSIAKGLAFLAPYLGNPQSSWPYAQINEWDRAQSFLAWTMYKSTFVQPNPAYEAAFLANANASASDLRWLTWPL